MSFDAKPPNSAQKRADDPKTMSIALVPLRAMYVLGKKYLLETHETGSRMGREGGGGRAVVHQSSDNWLFICSTSFHSAPKCRSHLPIIFTQHVAIIFTIGRTRRVVRWSRRNKERAGGSICGRSAPEACDIHPLGKHGGVSEAICIYTYSQMKWPAQNIC